MRQEKLLDLIGQVDEKFVDEAKPTRKRMNWMKWSAIAACLAVGLVGILFGQNMYAKYNTEVSYICLDVNPSVELCLNHKDKVIDAIAYNEDGRTVLDLVEHKNRHYKDVVSDILHHEEFQKYLTEDLTITIVSDKEEIRENVENCVTSVECDGNVVCADAATRETAHNNHCSVGKYIAYEELSQYDSDVTLDECKEMTMHEIYEQIEKHHSHHGNSDDTKSDYQYSGGHHSECH